MALTTETITLSVSPNPANFGAMVTLTATVTPSIVHTNGGVTFYANGGQIGGGSIVNGQCSMQISTLPSGVNTMVVTFTALPLVYTSARSTNVYLTINPATVAGYVNPKYIILGVSYAPPGPQSYVQYGDTTTTGNSTSLSSSMASGVSYSVAVSASYGCSSCLDNIFGVSDTQTDTYSTTYTDETDANSSVALSSTSTWINKVPGPASAYYSTGVDHDYDVIWLWLNPLINASIQTANTKNLTWTGFSSDADDIPEMDIYPVYLGWLNGHLTSPGPGSSDFTPLYRNWALAADNGQNWPASCLPQPSNPPQSNSACPSVVNPTDYSAIAAADPFSVSTYTVAVTPGTVTSTDGRFTLTGNQEIVYVQPPPGGQPATQDITEETTQTQTQGQGVKLTYSNAYSFENLFKTSSFLDSFSTDTKDTTTLTFTSQWSKTNNSGNAVTATGQITGPPCNVVNTLCSPVYTGPTEFEVFMDNLYNTYMFYPVN